MTDRPEQGLASVVMRDPVHLLAFGFGTGLAPKAPGTVGTLVGVLFAWLALPLPMAYRIVLGVALAVRRGFAGAPGSWSCVSYGEGTSAGASSEGSRLRLLKTSTVPDRRAPGGGSAAGDGGSGGLSCTGSSAFEELLRKTLPLTLPRPVPRDMSNRSRTTSRTWSAS